MRAAWTRGLGAILMVCGVLGPSAQAADAFAGFSVYGAYGGDHPTVQSQRLQGLFEGRYDLNPTLRVHGLARIEVDSEDALEPGRPDQANRSQASRRWLMVDHGAAELEELYFDLRTGGWTLRVGKQQTVWGTSDGLKVLDIVNPQSFREFILDDYERTRIPLWTASAVRGFGERNVLELLVIPDLTFHDIPERGALFEITSPQLTPQGAMQTPGALSVLVEQIGAGFGDNGADLDPVFDPLAPLLMTLDGVATSLIPQALSDLLAPRIIERTQRPGSGFGHPEWGVRLRGAVGEVEGALSVLRHYSDVPSVAVNIESDRVDVVRRYQRQTSYGVQLSRPLGATLVRFEGVYGTRAPIPALDFRDDGRSALAPAYGAAAGVDLPVRDAGLVSVQLGQFGAITDSRHYETPTRNPFATALWRDEIIANQVTGEVFTAVSLERGDLMVRARVFWGLRPSLLLRLGVDVLEGDRRGTFGQFDARDRLSLELIWSI